MGDHDADETTPDSTMGFSPIGTDDNRFKGFFDGKKYKIRNLYINRKGYDHIGLFGYSELESKIENLVLIDSYTTGNYYVGSLVGYNRGDVTNCSLSGEVNGSTSTGGLIGRNDENLEYCQFNGKVYGANNYTGGLAGISDGYIKMSFTNGSVEGKTNTGGFIGSNTGTVVNCYSSANTVGTVSVGGFAGYHEGHISHCYSNPSVKGTESVGGFIGLFNGLIGNSFWDKDKSGLDSVGFAAMAKTTFEMQDQYTYTSFNWNFETIWDMDYQHNYNDRYPFLRFPDLLSSVTEDKYGDNKYLTLSPNPVQDKLNISLLVNQLISDVEIVDLSGKVVYTSTELVNNQLDVSNLIKGTYFIKVTVSEMIYFDIFVK